MNVTQSVGYYSFKSEDEAKEQIERLNKDYIKVFVHLTRYGNFNNIIVLKHIRFLDNISFSKSEDEIIKELRALIKY